MFQDSNASLLQAIFDVWAEMGIEVTVQTDDMPSFRASWQANDGIDLMFTRWAADYDDPDNFTHTHFNSRTGQLRAYFSSDESDKLLDQARTEAQPGAREDLYRKYENLLQESAALAPLFNDVDYRVASPQVRGLTMRSFSPNVNYAELGKAETAGATVAPVAEARGRFQIPMSGVVVNFDPAWVAALEQNEVLPNVYETLTRGVGDARIASWHAAVGIVRTTRVRGAAPAVRRVV